MTWKVKGRDPDGTVHEILADEWPQACDLAADHQSRGRVTWIENTEGKVVTVQDVIADRFRTEVREMRNWLQIERDEIRRGRGSPDWASTLEARISELEAIIHKHEAKSA